VLKDRWAVLVSGRGSNLSALLEMRDVLDIRLVVSSNAKAPALLKAKRAGVPTLLLEKKIDWQKLDRALRAHGVNHIFLAGFMKVVPADFVQRWQGKILNLHPSLLPAYPGLKSIERAFEERADLGVSVHLVNEGVDEGPLLAQRRTIAAAQIAKQSLSEIEFKVHVDEQRLVRETMFKWKS
jgi:phosphoribosylglycinamide formyltransferase 1